jgi:nicotinamidase-related amidase
LEVPGYLTADPVDGFVIAGVELRCCVVFAWLGADERGYHFVVPQDLVSALTWVMTPTIWRRGSC